MIRVATEQDATAILSIYAPFIETPVTFENEVPPIDAFKSRITHYTKTYPWLVFIENNEVVGYAYASTYRERIAYQWSIECSVYISPASQRKGIAVKLYQALFNLLKMQGFKTVYAIITLPNEKSVGLHESLGFVHFATYENVGYKLGTWHSVGWWQLTLNPYKIPPAAPIPFSELSQEVVDRYINP